MSSGERDSLNLGFPYVVCYLSGCCNISAMAGHYIINFFEKSAADSRYDVRKHIQKPDIL